jgi:hypothetical protein
LDFYTSLPKQEFQLLRLILLNYQSPQTGFNSKEKKMEIIAIPTTLLISAAVLSAIFPPAGWAFGLFVFGAGLVARGDG